MSLNNPKRLFGLIGFPLTHSFSKQYFTEKFRKEGIDDVSYELFPLSSIGDFTGLVQKYPNLAGLNVTIPYKETVIKYLSTIELGALEVGAVNTISFAGEKSIGYNTDVFGFELSLKNWLATLHMPFPQNAMVLGSGGGSKAVQYVLRKLNIGFTVVSRTASDHTTAYAALEKKIYKTHQLIINTTPLGMAPNITSAPDINYDLLSPQHLLYDLVYNPEKTVFLSRGEARGCHIKNGLEMLRLQAEESWNIWNL